MVCHQALAGALPGWEEFGQTTRGLIGDAVETFIRREDAERFIEEVRGDDAEVASHLRIERRELEAGQRN